MADEDNLPSDYSKYIDGYGADDLDNISNTSDDTIVASTPLTDAIINTVATTDNNATNGTTDDTTDDNTCGKLNQGGAILDSEKSDSDDDSVGGSSGNDSDDSIDDEIIGAYLNGSDDEDAIYLGFDDYDEYETPNSFTINDFTLGGDHLDGLSTEGVRHLDASINIITPENKSELSGVVPAVVSTECSIVAENKETCISDQTITEIADAVGVTATTSTEKLNKSMEKLNCDDAKCVLESNIVVNKIGSDRAKATLKRNFKINGPIDVSLLSNINIDDILDQIQTKFKQFYHYNFNMLDFKANGDTLATVDVYNDIYKKGFTTAGCVINSDLYSGRGKHWMALFIDLRNNPWTVEFYNSSGNLPQKQFDEWLNESVHKLTYGNISSDGQLAQKQNVKKVIATRIRQQQSRTECGVFSLFYIWSRLNGVPYSFFTNNSVHDKLMFEFRQHLFNGKNTEEFLTSDGKFDYKAFEDLAKPKWESGAIII